MEAGIEEQLGKKIPLNLFFIDENGDSVQLKELVKKPTIFLFVYYNCTSLCNPLMAEVASHISKLDLEPGKDYNIISISFDEKENWKLAASRKINYLHAIEKDFPEDAWRFLTADSITINKITKAFGFKFKRLNTQFSHPSALILTSPEGKITRYLPGTTFLTFDIKMALIEASEGKVGPTISKVLQFCFSYDVEGRKYVLNITRIAGVGIIFLAILFVILLTIKPKNKKYNKGI